MIHSYVKFPIRVTRIGEPLILESPCLTDGELIQVGEWSMGVSLKKTGCFPNFLGHLIGIMMIN